MKKNKWIVPVAVIAGIIIIGIIWWFSTYNSIVRKEEAVKTAWAQVENQYQRRSDLIPNLVNTVKGYAAHEAQTLENVIAARNQAAGARVDMNNLTPEAIAQYQSAQGQVTSALDRLMVVVERYPDLKASQNFSELQAQLEGTENRIAVERNRFNEVTRLYNTQIRTFPSSIVADRKGFEQMPLFQAQEGANVAPVVQF